MQVKVGDFGLATTVDYDGERYSETCLAYLSTTESVIVMKVKLKEKDVMWNS